MKCPVCNDVRMREVEKNGVHIDVCPDCKGVWLDRGELDKLMLGVREVREEYNEWHREPPPQPQIPPYPQGKPRSDSDDYRYPPKYKKKNTVLDIFNDLF
ncbi:zf-TFIIB domain-containing protein [Paenibacillus sp.]|uniref:TFIIB-type zinc ribbon-containing protein n=1 Tax=Paenibacillus sp. TaxID=58172 RepID=UPI002811C4AC|nr:zf-TFIIB domain-containing protein [Paenibacillus sp.]